MKRENQAFNGQSLAHIKTRFEEQTGVRLQRKRSGGRAGRAIAVALAAFLCLAVTTSALAAGSPETYALLYLISPKTAQFFKPVEMESVDQGIEVKVVSAYIHGASASVLVTVRDLESDRLDGSLDLYDSYEINTGFDCIGYCEQIGYDEETKTATFLITVESMDADDVITGEKVTFSLTTLLCGAVRTDAVPVDIDWSTIPATVDTETSDPYDAIVLVPGEVKSTLLEGFYLTGLGYIGDELHIQLYTPGRSQYDDHAFLYLQDESGERIEAQMLYRGGYNTGDLSDEFRADHIDYTFGIPQEELSEYLLFGDFHHAGNRIDGNWSVTFPLEIED